MPILDKYPKEITKDADNNMHVASFDYYTGIAVAKDKELKQTTNFEDVFNETHFIVCCGDVMIRVKETDYPELNRRVI
jgi:hypothetical protein